MEWQPIETAPKIGDYLIFQPKVDKRIPLEARIVLKSDGGYHRMASHWMPLPEPPQ